MAKAFDLLLGATLLWAAVRLALRAELAAEFAAGLQAAVALAIILRAPERRPASKAELVAALPSLLIAAVTVQAASHARWPVVSLVLGGVGAAVSLGAVLSLGKSFAILPGVRTLRTGGLYRLVRHPLYLGESLLFAGAAAALGAWGAVAAVLLAPMLAWRIHVEERLLSVEPGWSEWAARVRWRLLPFVW
ncbi:MAG: methyltransferase [Myxococcota bacterium]